MGPGGFFLTNPDRANILGRMDLDFENFHFLFLLVPRFPDRAAGLGLDLGRAWAAPRWAWLSQNGRRKRICERGWVYQNGHSSWVYEQGWVYGWLRTQVAIRHTKNGHNGWLSVKDTTDG